MALVAGFFGIDFWEVLIAPHLGLQPSTIRDSAIQIGADIRALKEY
jgi:hypothetical protein